MPLMKYALERIAALILFAVIGMAIYGIFAAIRIAKDFEQDFAQYNNNNNKQG